MAAAIGLKARFMWVALRMGSSILSPHAERLMRAPVEHGGLSLACFSRGERSGTDLFNTIRDQLLTKYMAADECRAGCLLVTIAKGRKWDHPKTGKRIGFEELMGVLNEEAERLSKELGGTAKLMARGLDLRPRLGTESRHANDVSQMR
jgi:hypothetical protein